MTTESVDLANQLADQLTKTWALMPPKIAAELRKSVPSDDITDSSPPTPQREQEIMADVEKLARFMRSFKRPWFLAGSLALELAQGQITRDHHDLDIEIFASDKEDFYNYARRRQYGFFEHDGKTVTRSQEVETGNLVGSFFDPPRGPNSFDLFLLYQDPESGSVYSNLTSDIKFPIEIYQNPREYALGRRLKVPLCPPESVLLYKTFHYGLMLGRQKDFDDIRRFLPLLDNDQSERFIDKTLVAAEQLIQLIHMKDLAQ